MITLDTFADLVAGLAATHPHDSMWAVLNDWRGDRGQEPLTLDEIRDLICDHPTANGPRWLYAETLDTLPEWERAEVPTDAAHSAHVPTATVGVVTGIDRVGSVAGPGSGVIDGFGWVAGVSG